MWDNYAKAVVLIITSGCIILFSGTIPPVLNSMRLDTIFTLKCFCTPLCPLTHNDGA